MNFKAMISIGYLSFSRGDSHFCLDVRHVREIVDGSGFIPRSELVGSRSVTLRDAQLQIVDIALPRDRALFQVPFPLIIVVEMDGEVATGMIGIIADRIDSKLLSGAAETSVAAGFIDAEEILRQRLFDIA